MRSQPGADAAGLIFNFAIVSLSWLLTALARLKADDYRQMRHMYIRLPRAGPAAAPAEVQECPECCLYPQHGRLAA